MTNDPQNKNPDGSPGAGCRKVESPAECKMEGPDCERHVIVYLPKGESFDDFDAGAGNKPNYHAAGQYKCGSPYWHQTGGQGTIFGPLDGNPRKEVENYYKDIGVDPSSLQETHYCCPKDQ